MEYKTDAVLDIRGNAVFNASVRVLTESRQLATIYNASGVQITNPVSTDKTGEYSVAAPNGKYYLETSVNGTVYETRGPVSFFDSSDDPAVREDDLAMADAATKIGYGATNVAAVLDSVQEDVLALTLGSSGFSWDDIVAPLYVAHRGMEMSFPENTMVAFQEAVKAGAGAIEMDCYLMADGSIVVIHDSTTARTCRLPDTTSINLNVESLSAQDTYGLDASYKVASTEFGFAGSDFENNPPPLLNEVLATLKGKALLMVEAKGTTLEKAALCAQAVADQVDKLKMQASVVIQSAQDLMAAGVNLRGCKWGYITTATQQTGAQLDALIASGCYMIIMDKAGLDATYKSIVNFKGMKVAAYTYSRPDQIGTMPDIVLAVDTTIVASKRLAGSRDYLMRKYPGPGYTRDGFGGSPGNSRVVPVIRTISSRKAIGWPEVATPAGAISRTVICCLDPDPNNDGQYVLDFDVMWTAFDAAMTSFCFVSVELEKAGTLAENAASSDSKKGYSVGFRANGAGGIYRLAGATPVATAIATTTSLPNPPVINQPYPCRITVTSTSVSAIFDVGGLNVTMSANDTTHRGGKYIQLERRGHGFMIANLRAS